MRSCEEMELLINLCLDDMLPSQEMDVLKAHLETCPACRERFAQLREMKAALADMEVPVPGDLHEKIMAYVAENTADETAPAKILRPKRWYRALATVAACAVIAVAAARFVPNLQNNSAESLVTAPQAPGIVFDNTAVESEKTPGTVQNTNLNDVPAKQPVASAQPESGMFPEVPSEPTMPDQQTGQMAEDLPPLRQQDEKNQQIQEHSIRKWLKAEGQQEKLPAWVNDQYVYETQMDGKTVSYVEIAAWAEDYWTDQLCACGFTVEEMEGQDLSADGEYLLLFFFWTE